MSKRFFQRLIAVLIIVFIFFINISSIFKDILFIMFAILLFLSTFDIRKNKRV